MPRCSLSSGSPGRIKEAFPRHDVSKPQCSPVQWRAEGATSGFEAPSQPGSGEDLLCPVCPIPGSRPVSSQADARLDPDTPARRVTTLPSSPATGQDQTDAAAQGLRNSPAVGTD